MNKPEFIKLVAEKTGETIKYTEPIVNAVFECIGDVLHDGGEVGIVGFGTFSAHKRAGRVGVNPKTKEKIQIPPTTTPHFKAGKNLKELVN